MKEEIVKLRKEGKTFNEIKKIVGCAKSTISYHCRKENINDFNKLKKPTEDEIINFQILYDEHKSSIVVSKLTGWSKQTVLKYITTKSRKFQTKEERKKSVSVGVVNWRRRTKEKLVEYKGGKCIKCGYNKCVDALEFHHKNPNEKEFGISTKGITRSFEKLKVEVDKCDLVCANCHKEIHYELKQKVAVNLS